MSISIGFISRSFALIASDSRKFTSAKVNLTTGEVTLLAKIDDDNFDKTLSIGKNLIIGGYTGLMDIENISIPMIIENIYQKECCELNDNEDVINTIANSLKTKLNSLDEKFVSKKLIKLDILLITSKQFLNNFFTIHYLRFRPDSNNLIELSIESKPRNRIGKNHVDWWIIGDDQAQKEASKFIQYQIDNNINNNFKFVRSLAYKAIRHGIKNCERHPYCDENSCGGTPIVKFIK